MILAIDTATDWVGLALHDGGTVTAEFGWRSRRTQTIELAPAVAQLWARTGVSANDLNAIAVANGPGSYTGLRVGLALAKGIALGQKLPLIGVPTLDVVAAAVPRLETDLVALAQAGRSRLWAGQYSWNGKHGWESVGDPMLTQWDDLLSRLQVPVAFAGEIDAAAAKLIRRVNRSAHIVGPAASVRRAAVLAEIGWTRWKKQQVTEADALAPFYLREPG
ncbi:MAG: tRNA (adenosine(37)-N6)-threonylcarbamoyltransferase complex dimerization subunit type 1 TsaB [Anaerolineae bacterium]|uniref:tRNA (adenosine(37)-N6)-threonylcarbamoyltransferase complex dimerization subunit type 1 TsaB n=1 Tax=Promineifilum sp. TaxID=2664178 RepID=UPI001DAF5959|nr:tRNA (adenosine(37)-N6)-threonylcarbamoyltransferase complex dimerization subunit type 1 TsaB [Anaerolineales bacterium]MCB8935371.1 tRNA (adenosine(37)-N6)-threonylcarbamoyltransferase complex dimerization subunit type 1 TsaB [Promineifilum sp.]MCO5181985.1 tRNA (adenosine(37)-N6)-threonylcarbamoyltransferase complex dimerization subunit type 1 TsaB [Promineifilum sp.]MCW5846522.1 tRNA (adenosine(37)-N6)-threonylcarbamoyltransferase complex dimerization subunit type 1 TsaB [Anaerolineae bact